MMRTFARARPPRDGERGVAAVEFAIIASLFFTLVLGCIEYGWYFFIHQRVVNAAREGARAGTLLDPPPGTEDAGEARALDAAQDYLEQVGLERTGVVATYELIGGAGGVDAIRVQIDYPIEPLTGFFTGLGLVPTHARATSVMRWQ